MRHMGRHLSCSPLRSVRFEMCGCLPLVQECCKDTAVQQEGYGLFMLKSTGMPWFQFSGKEDHVHFSVRSEASLLKGSNNQSLQGSASSPCLPAHDSPGPSQTFFLVAGRPLKVLILSSNKILSLNSLCKCLKIDSLSFCNPMTNAKERCQVRGFFKVITYMWHWSKSAFLSEWVTMPGSGAVCGLEMLSFELFEAS